MSPPRVDAKVAGAVRPGSSRRVAAPVPVAVRRRRHLALHDFAGHPFTADLARGLAATGLEVTYLSCSGVAAGHGDLARRPDDPPGLRFIDVDATEFERYSFVGRLRSEERYGRRVADVVSLLHADVVLSANTPLRAQQLLWQEAGRLGMGRIYWLQDFLGSGTQAVLRRKNALLGETAGRVWPALEARLLRQSDAIVAIADEFVDELARRGVDRPTTVVENWAPLEIVAAPKANEWSIAHGLHEVPVALYSGTLGLKHDPEHLVALARALRGSRRRLVVLTEGIGRDHLEAAKRAEGLDELLLFDLVPYHQLPMTLGCADVCLSLLEGDADSFSVPSKILSYLAAARPVVGAMPAANLASRTIARAGAGHVVDPGDHDGFARAALAVLDGDAGTLGRQARAHAEATFAIEAIADRFLAVIDAAAPAPAARMAS